MCKCHFPLRCMYVFHFHIHLKVLSLTYNSLQSSQPTYLRELSAFSQPALPDPPSVSPFLDPRSPRISRSPREPYPSLHHVSGIGHLNSAPFLYLYHHHSKS